MAGGIVLDDLELDNNDNIILDKLSSSRYAAEKARKYEEDFINNKLQELVDSRKKYSLNEVQSLINLGAKYKADNANLKKVIERYIEFAGTECNLNWIDTSEITDMSELFANSTFNGDISKWNVSNAKYMSWMFANSQFNGDISGWDVSNVEYMSWMFAESEFSGDISNWNVSKVIFLNGMFAASQFNGDISGWDISKAIVMNYMFTGSQFAGDVSNWDVAKVRYKRFAFSNCPIPEKNKPQNL